LPDYLRDMLGDGERTRDGNAVIARAVMPAERTVLIERRSELKGWLQACRVKPTTKRIAETLAGFEKRALSGEEADVIASQYHHVMRLLPEWAIVRACDRFAAGTVDPAEVKAKRIDWAWGPTSAQLNLVASAIARPLFEEYARIEKVLNGVVALPKPAPDPRAAEKIEEAARKFAMQHAGERELAAAARLAASAEVLKRTKEGNERLRASEYEAAGLEPHASGVSLSMLLKLGYRIEDGPAPGQKILVSPPLGALDRAG
jgi:hypothetical protein